MPAQLVVDSEDVLSPNYVPPKEGEPDPAKPGAEDALLGEIQSGPEPVNYKLTDKDIPEQYRDKYRDKDARELLDIIVNQEQVIGSHGQRIGELTERTGTLQGLVDKALVLREDGHSGRAEDLDESVLEDDDFTLTPQKAVTETVRRETAIDRERLARLENQANASDFERRHPTAKADINSQKFIDFVKTSPYRTGLAGKAFADLENIDIGAADELWLAWEEQSELDGSSTDPKKASDADGSGGNPSDNDDPKKAKGEDLSGKLDNASLVSGGGGGGDPDQDVKIYSTAALERLQLEKPKLYWAKDTQKIISKAYADGRVRD